jgi:preprotein translocase subunit SecE
LAQPGERWEHTMNESLEKIKTWPKSVQDYVNELKLEMRRVTWPSRKQVESTTAVVILTVFAFAAYFQVVDQVLARSITQITHVFAK